MDIATIAAHALALATPYLIEAGKEIGKGIGKDLWNLIKSPFESDKEQKLIQDFEENPTDEKKQAQVEYVLSEKLEADKELINKLLDVISKLEQSGQTIVHGDYIQGNKIIHGDSIGGNKITINKTSND